MTLQPPQPFLIEGTLDGFSFPVRIFAPDFASAASEWLFRYRDIGGRLQGDCGANGGQERPMAADLGPSEDVRGVKTVKSVRKRGGNAKAAPTTTVPALPVVKSLRIRKRGGK